MFSDDELVQHWRFATARFATADEVATVLSGLLGLRDLKLGDVHATIVSSVVPTLAHEYEQMIERYFDGRGALVGPELKTGMPIRIDRPQELGADRLVNAIAAYERVGGACIAVDFGTAINYDVVSSEGEYLGGVISPGIEISLEALSARAARLPAWTSRSRATRSARAPRRPSSPGWCSASPARWTDRRPAAGGAGRGGHRDRHGRLRRRDRAVLRAGRRGGRPAHSPGAEADLGAQQRLSYPSRETGVRWNSVGRPPRVTCLPNPSMSRSRITGAWWSCACRVRWTPRPRPGWARSWTGSSRAERRVVLDLSSVDFMDLHGLAVIMRAARRERATAASSSRAPRLACCACSSLIHADGEVPILPDGPDPLEAAEPRYRFRTCARSPTPGRSAA